MADETNKPAAASPTAGATPPSADPAAGKPAAGPQPESSATATLDEPASAGPAPAADVHPPKSFNLPSFDAAGSKHSATGLDLLADVNLNVKIELGRTRMLVEDVLRLAEGSVVELDKLAGDPVDVYVNDRHVARGEVLVLNDNFCIRINEIITPQSEVAAA